MVILVETYHVFVSAIQSHFMNYCNRKTSRGALMIERAEYLRGYQWTDGTEGATLSEATPRQMYVAAADTDAT